MRLEIAPLAAPRTLRVAGELDLATAAEFGERMEAESQGAGDLTLDISDLSFIDSTGVRALLWAAHAMAARGRLILLAPSAPVRRVLDGMGLTGPGSRLVVQGTGSPLAAAAETRSFAPDRDALADVRRFIRSRALADGFAEWADDIVLAVNEACANAVVHSGTWEIAVTWRATSDRAEVEVRDEGIFHRAIPAESAGITSRGILLMMSVVDQLTITCGTDARPGTMVRMVKFKNGRPTARGREGRSGRATTRFPQGRPRVAS